MNSPSLIQQTDNNLSKYKFEFDDEDEDFKSEEKSECVVAIYDGDSEPGIRWDPLGSDNTTNDNKIEQIIFDKTDDR